MTAYASRPACLRQRCESAAAGQPNAAATPRPGTPPTPHDHELAHAAFSIFLRFPKVGEGSDRAGRPTGWLLGQVLIHDPGFLFSRPLRYGVYLNPRPASRAVRESASRHHAALSFPAGALPSRHGRTKSELRAKVCNPAGRPARLAHHHGCLQRVPAAGADAPLGAHCPSSRPHSPHRRRAPAPLPALREPRGQQRLRNNRRPGVAPHPAP